MGTSATYAPVAGDVHNLWKRRFRAERSNVARRRVKLPFRRNEEIGELEELVVCADDHGVIAASERHVVGDLQDGLIEMDSGGLLVL